MSYTPVVLTPLIEIPEIVTVHYFEYNNNFSFAGEAHDFWEFLCVDKGEVEVVADTRTYQLSRGDIIFHKPNEFHRLKASPTHAPNLVVISFVCESDAMTFFEDKLLSIDAYEREQLAQIIIEARNAFMGPLDDPLLTHMQTRTDALTGARQMIALHLELFLIHLLRKNIHPDSVPVAKETIRQKHNDERYQRILEYLQQHLSEQLTMEQIARDTLVGTSQLQQLIRSRHQCGVMRFFSTLKINHAKQLIRDNMLNFTEISDLLGYSSIHYFSRQFKQIAGMTPSEYSSSIQKLSDATYGTS